MAEISAPPTRAYRIRVEFFSDSELFAVDTFTIDLPDGQDPITAAEGLADESIYFDERIPDLSRTIAIEPLESVGLTEFGKYVVLSTAHIRCATAELLQSWAGLSANAQPLVIASTQCGWFVSTYPIDGPDLAHLPAELPDILAFARDHDCDYVLLDCDGGRSDALPVFPW
jgi:hypothetical protein